MKTILAPVDLSPVSTKVVAQAAELARGLHGRVVLLTAMIPPALVKEFAAAPTIGRVMIGTEKAAKRELAVLQERLKAKSIPATSILLQGQPVRIIIEKARATNASYIVMGSHGHTAFFDLVAGSTTHGVVNRASCPVVIMPSRKTRTRRARR